MLQLWAWRGIPCADQVHPSSIREIEPATPPHLPMMHQLKLKWHNKNTLIRASFLTGIDGRGFTLHWFGIQLRSGPNEELAQLCRVQGLGRLEQGDAFSMQ